MFVMTASAMGARASNTLRRAGTVLVTLLGLLALTFVIGRVMPLDPVLAVVGPDADSSTYDQVYRSMGLDQPIWTQFGLYLNDLLHGDFGNALLTGHPVLDDILRVFPATIELATLAILFGVLIGLPLGVCAASNQGRLGDHVARVITLFGYSTPIFWLGMMGLLVFYALQMAPLMRLLFFPSLEGLVDEPLSRNFRYEIEIPSRMRRPEPVGSYPSLCGTA